MTTFNTGNPLGSTDVYDRYDNSENLDNFSNGPLDAYADRLGVMRQSLQGIRNASQYVNLGPYAAGLNFTALNQVFSYLGEFYAPGPSIVLPYTTTGVGAGEIANFRSVGDAVLRQDLASSSNPAKGAALVGYKGQTVRQRLSNEVWVTDFAGCDPTGATDSYAAFQAATDFVAANALGGKVRIPDGTFLISGGTITNDRSLTPALGRVSYQGESTFGTRIIYTGAGNDCFYLANNQDPAAEQAASYQSITDMTIIGPSMRTNSSGITVNVGSFIKIERVISTNFDFGIYLQDVDQSYFEKLNLRFNKRGIFASKSAAPGLSSTQPNNHVYSSCAIANNDTYGGLFVGASAITFIGGDVEYNGAGAAGAGFGLKFQDSCYEGGVGANLSGVYFEGNAGVADLILSAITNTYGPILGAVHNVHGCTFHRNGVNPNVNNITCAFGDQLTVGVQKLVTVGCGFKTFASYVPSGATPTIGYSNTGANSSNYYDVGSLFTSSVEKPAFVQSVNKIDSVTTKTANQTIATATTTKWLLDTVVAPSTLWTPSIVANEVVIPEAGTYSVSALLVFASTVAGTKFILISKNGAVVGFGESTGSATLCSANTTVRCAAGDSIKIHINQATGGSLDVVGGGTSASAVSIVKLFG